MTDLTGILWHCDACGADLSGDPIPEEMRNNYSGAANWSRRIGQSNGDHVVAWQCPDCGDEVPAAGVQREGEG